MVPLVLICATAPLGNAPDPSPSTSGTETKNFWVLGCHTGCSAPLVALTPLAVVSVIFCLIVSWQVDETLIKVPNGGVSALLIARIRLSFGSNASSSARWVPPVFTELTTVVKLVL